MKRLAGMLLMAIVTVCARAEYKITFLNTPTITINGVEYQRGDTFKSNHYSVSWVSPRQAMKVKDTETGEQVLIVAEEYNRSRVKDIIEYISQEKHLVSREGLPNNIVSLRNLLDRRFYFTDSLTIATGFPTDKDHFFYISYRYNGQDINKLILNEQGSFTISPDIFTIDGSPIPPFETTIAVYYLDQTAGTVSLICDTMWISLIPEDLAL